MDDILEIGTVKIAVMITTGVGKWTDAKLHISESTWRAPS